MFGRAKISWIFASIFEPFVYENEMKNVWRQKNKSAWIIIITTQHARSLVIIYMGKFLNTRQLKVILWFKTKSAFKNVTTLTFIPSNEFIFFMVNVWRGNSSLSPAFESHKQKIASQSCIASVDRKLLKLLVLRSTPFTF